MIHVKHSIDQVLYEFLTVLNLGGTILDVAVENEFIMKASHRHHSMWLANMITIHLWIHHILYFALKEGYSFSYFESRSCTLIRAFNTSREYGMLTKSFAPASSVATTSDWFVS